MHASRPLHAAVLLFAALVAAPAPAQQTCLGDCNGSFIIEINELIRGVNISLGNAAVDTCPAFDADGTGLVEIYELIAAVRNSLNGCAAGTPSKSNKSGPIAITPDGDIVVAVNTDTNSASIFEVAGDGRLTKVKEVVVGTEPRSVALLPNGNWAYVANAVSGTVTVINLLTYETSSITVGVEPWAAVASPNGLYVYVANASSNTVSVIDTVTNTVFATAAVGRSPRALAITNDGDDDDLDEHIYVPNFYARPRVGFTPPSSAGLGGSDGAAAAFPTGSTNQAVIGEGIFDDSREGVIDVVSATTNTVVDQVILAPVADTGFKFPRGAFVNSTPGDAPRTIFADGGTDGSVAQNAGAFPNLLLSIAILGNRAFLPSTAPSPEPPLRFNVNVQSLLSVVDVSRNAELADQTFNLNRGINFDLPPDLEEAEIRDNTDRLFPSAPVDIDCSDVTNACWVVSQGSDFVVRMTFNDQDKPTINAPTAAGPFAVSPVTRIYTIDKADPLRSGRNPRGIVIGPDGTVGYVVCPTTRDVIVLDLIGNAVLQRARSSELPQAGSTAETIRRGKIDFTTSRPFWSDRGWGGCWSCHPDGRTDTVTWSFEAGPRQTISLDGTFNHNDPEDQRALNWSPVRDENQDFELNTRGVFGGRGFIVVDTDVNGDGLVPDSDPNVRNFGPASSGRSSQQEDLTAYIQLAIRSAIAPPSSGGNPTRGRTLFGSPAPAGANCVACHSGGKWSTSRITYDQSDVNPVPGTETGIVNIPPPDLDGNGTIDASEAKAVSVYLNAFNSANGAGRVCEVPPPPGVDTERIRIARQVGTFSATNPIEVRSNALSPVNTNLPMLTVAAAFGSDGFNTPTLLGIFDSAPYFRHGSAVTLAQVFGRGTDPNVLPAAQAHWRSGTSGMPNILDTDPSAVTDLLAFVGTIDSATPAFPPADRAPNDPVFADANAQCDCQKDVPLGTPAIDCLP
ncbi:MAG: YncE family protein [Candidatus Binatia bacterium]